jgi:DNA polymerase V
MAREAAQPAGGSITVFIETDKFKPEPQYASAVAMTVAPKSDSAIELRDLALSGLAKVLRSGFRYRRAGSTPGGLELVERVSMRLWENEGYERHRRLMAAIDRVNAKFGRDAVRCGLLTLGAARSGGNMWNERNRRSVSDALPSVPFFFLLRVLRT